MKTRSISLIVGLMSFALLGVMGMQLYFLSQSYKLKTQLFDQAVNEALGNVVARIEKQDAFDFLNRKIISERANKIHHKPTKQLVYHPRHLRKDSLAIIRRNSERYARLLRKEQRKADSIFTVHERALKSNYPLVVSVNEPQAGDDGEQQVNLQVDVLEYEDAFGQLHQRTVTRALPSNPTAGIGFQNGRKVNKVRLDSLKQYIVFDPQLGAKLVTLPKPKMNQINPDDYKKEFVKKHTIARQVRRFLDSVQVINRKQNVFQDLAAEMQQVDMPLSIRVKSSSLDSILRIELANRGVNIPYQYKITLANKDSVIFRTTANVADFLPDNTYRTPLFPKDMIRDAGLLTINFPDKNSIIFSNMSAMMGSSAALLLILLFCFGYTLHSILRQKKISEMKTDFINNMTHEFKTPVATIMIASEALKDPEITEDKQRIKRLAGIIYDENIRLGNHIERVLNIAKIDKEDLKLESSEVEMNDLIALVVDSMSLQLQKKNASINLSLHAAQSTVLGDELHLSNVIFNLIDNANKYSKENPQIHISTHNSGKNLVIQLADNGIGMGREQLSKIFDQFYRVPTGNLHDVKGFGLGLSYVSKIVKRLNGSIRVKSEKDKGSEFELIFPTI